MKKNGLFLLTGLLILLTAWEIASKYPAGMFEEPRLGTYRSDEQIFLKTYYLVEKGWNYYPAFSWAVEGDVRGIGLTSDVFQWRLPTVFYIWKVLADNGWQVLFLFWVFSLAVLAAVFLLIKKLASPLIGVISVVVLVPYFADAFQYQSSFLFTEWWGWFWFVFGLSAFAYNKRLMAYGLWLMAVVTRELLIIPILAMFLVALLQKKHRLGLLLVILGFGLFMWSHRGTVVTFMQGAEVHSAPLVARLHGFDKNSLMTMLAFSMRKYPLIQYKSNWILVGLAGLSLGKLLWKRKFDSPLLFLYLAGWSLFFTLPFITNSIYNDYWGILFLPMMLITIPLLIT